MSNKNFNDVRIEICTDSVAGVLAAEAGGAQATELCASLVEGGTTPSFGSIALSREQSSIEIAAIIRPRGGDFLYTESEVDVMARDIEAAKTSGAHAVVFGLLTADGHIDHERTRRLIECARPMQVTVHRAFDMTVDPFAALDTLIELGVDRVLTSGQRAGVEEGLELLIQLVQRAEGRIRVMPGCGVTEQNIRHIVATTGVRDIHFTARQRAESGMQFRNPHVSMADGLSCGEYELNVTQASRVSAFVTALRG